MTATSYSGRILRSLTLTISLLLLCSADGAFAQWTGNATTQTFNGNVSIGQSTPPTGKLEIVNPTGGFGNGSYLQVTGSTTDNNNLPDIVFKGGTGLGSAMWLYPSVKVTNGGYGLALWGGMSAAFQNPMEVVVDSGSGSMWVIAGSVTPLRAWASGNVAVGTSGTPLAPLDVHGAALTAGAARRNVVSFDTSAAGSGGNGGGIAFGGYYSAAGASTPDFANIWGIKENGTDNNNAGALLFATHGNLGTPAERMRIGSDGLVTVATAGSVGTKLQVNGDIFVTGNINAKYQDVAEWVPSGLQMPPGTVVVVDPDTPNHVKASSEPYSTAVAGVVSDLPGLILGEPSATKVKVATTGRVRVKVDATKSPVRIGDLLVASGARGMAMRSDPVDLGGIKFHRPGTIIGKALEPLPNGSGEILVLLSLQ
jgi:hypothetical protein